MPVAMPAWMRKASGTATTRETANSRPGATASRITSAAPTASSGTSEVRASTRPKAKNAGIEPPTTTNSAASSSRSGTSTSSSAPTRPSSVGPR